MALTTKKIQRRYPAQNWDYKAISAIINDDGTKKNIIYYTLKDKSGSSEGLEVYQGANYIVGEKGKSFSKNYKSDKVPLKYAKILAELKSVHNKTKWSDAERVDSN